MGETNEAAERLLEAIYQATPAGGTHSQKFTIWQQRIDAALTAERRATLERIRAAIGPELEVPEHETIYAAYERTGHNVLLREVRAILDEEAAR